VLRLPVQIFLGGCTLSIVHYPPLGGGSERIGMVQLARFRVRREPSEAHLSNDKPDRGSRDCFQRATRALTFILLCEK
jgi:hypothetical protein